MSERAYELCEGVELVFQTPRDGHSHFFGYYDKSPLDAANTRLLAHRVAFDGREVRDGDTAEVGYFELESGAYRPLGTTSAWNWQQGAQLQWLPFPSGERIIYNDMREGRYVSVIVEVDSGKERVLPYPVYAVHPGGTYALAVNYERFAFCRPGYNYQNLRNAKWDVPVHPEDGIYRVDLESGEVRCIVATQDMAAIDPDPDMQVANHWLEHMMWNPGGTRFAFLHRWEVSRSRGHQTRLFTADPEGGGLHMFPDVRFYSHMGWRGDSEFTVWALQPLSRTKAVVSLARHPIWFGLAKRLYQPVKYMLGTSRSAGLVRSEGYVHYVDRSDEFRVLNTELLPENGHNTWTRDGRLMLTDTYQDAQGYRHLLFFDNDRQTVVPLGRFYSVYNDCGHRADLHPRLSPDERLIIIDSAHQPERAMLVLRYSPS